MKPRDFRYTYLVLLTLLVMQIPVAAVNIVVNEESSVMEKNNDE